MNVLVNGEIVLFGTVGQGLFEEGFTAMDVVAALAEVGRNKPITVRINSGGGIATEGLAIFNALDSHRGRVKVVIDSIAASAASIIAMAGDEIVMKTGAMMMVHDPAVFTMGNSDDHAKSIEALETLAASMADIYAEKTGRDVAEIRTEMKTEVWMTAREAIAKGYADATEKGRAKEPTAFDYRLYQKAPERLVALAESRAWEHAGEEADEPAVTQSQTETPMADKEADGTANNNADTNAPADTAPAVTETPEQIEVRVQAATAAANARATDIFAACLIAGKAEKATEFVKSDKSLSDVVAALQADRPATAEIINRATNATPDKPASWAKAVERVNARMKN